MSDPLTKAIADGISALLALIGIGWAAAILNLFLMVAAITWVVKKVWYAGSNKPKKRKRRKKQKYQDWHSDDWLVQAQERQNRIYEYTDPVRTVEKKWSPTGWYYDDEKREWVAPDYIVEEANTRWEWNDEKRIWIDNSKRKRKKRR